jgi:hypothetical protein
LVLFTFFAHFLFISLSLYLFAYLYSSPWWSWLVSTLFTGIQNSDFLYLLASESPFGHIIIILSVQNRALIFCFTPCLFSLFLKMVLCLNSCILEMAKSLALFLTFYVLICHAWSVPRSIGLLKISKCQHLIIIFLLVRIVTYSKFTLNFSIPITCIFVWEKQNKWFTFSSLWIFRIIKYFLRLLQRARKRVCVCVCVCVCVTLVKSWI